MFFFVDTFCSTVWGRRPMQGGERTSHSAFQLGIFLGTCLERGHSHVDLVV